MFDKNDPLIDAVKKVMQTNAAEREAEKSVNEKFGIQDRKALPHEYMGEWNAEYKSVLSEGIEALDEAKGKRLLPGVNSPAASKIRDIAGPGLVQHAEPWHESHKDHNIFTHSNESNSVRKIRAFKVHQQTGKVSEIKNYVHGMGEEVKNAQKMPYIVKKGEKKLPLTPMPNATKPPKDKFANGVKLEEGEEGTVPKTPKERILAKMHGSKKHITHGDVLKARGIFEDETPMTRMGIKKPDYAPAGTTPDYAKTKEQTPNSAAKTSLPAGTLKKSIKENSLTSIQEEISYNLTEQAVGIYENSGPEEFLQYIDSLNEEQIDLLVMNEEFMDFIISEGVWDSIKAGARGAWDSATLGGGKYAVAGAKHLYNKATGKESSYSDEVDKEAAASEKAEKDNPTAYNTGGWAATAAQMATGIGGVAKLAAKGAMKLGMKSATKMATSGTSNAIKKTQKTANKLMGAGAGGHAGSMMTGHNKELEALREDLANYLYENFETAEEIDALTEDDLNRIVYEGATFDAIKKGGATALGWLGSKSRTVKDAVSSVAGFGSRNSTNTAAAGTAAGTDALKATAARGAAARARPSGASNGTGVTPAAAVPAAVTTVSKTAKVLDKLKNATSKVSTAIKNNPGKTAAAVGTGLVAAAGLSGDSTPKTASATGEGGAFDRNKTPTTSDSSKVPPKPKLKPANPGKAAPKAAAPVKKSKMKLKRKRPETRYERDNTIGADGRPTKGPGGVTTGTTIRK